MTSGPLYAAPQRDVCIDDCFFYHLTDLPGLGQVGGDWDLTDVADDYLGRIDYSGKRALDIGAASGYLSFQMEARGADVVSFDMCSGKSWNVVPRAANQQKLDSDSRSREVCHSRLQNAYWFCHQRLNSRAKVHYGDVYQLPLELGNFDTVFLGMILPHLRDPFQAIYSASRLAVDTLIITNPGRKTGLIDRLFGRLYQAKFLPSKSNDLVDAWWALSSSCIERMLGTVGFEVVDRIPCKGVLRRNGRAHISRNLSIVSKRVRGQAEGIAPTAAVAAA